MVTQHHYVCMRAISCVHHGLKDISRHCESDTHHKGLTKLNHHNHPGISSGVSTANIVYEKLKLLANAVIVVIVIGDTSRVKIAHLWLTTTHLASLFRYIFINSKRIQFCMDCILIGSIAQF